MIATSNTMIAKIFAALAVAGLVLGSFAALAPVAGAQTTTTTTTSGSTTTALTFMNDLTVGSTGVAVTSLQTFLIAKGFSIPAGATGYFGSQTKAAVAAYQSANGISPAVGYFGPITRAHVNAAGPSTGGGSSTVPGCSAGAAFSSTTGAPCSGSGSGSTSGLSGGEARLSSFELRREASDGSEGQVEVEVATAEFDVKDGDVRVERIELTVEAASSTLSMLPWNYIDRVSVWADGDELSDKRSTSRSDWSKSGNKYTIVLTDLDYVVDAGDTAALTFAFDINSRIRVADLSQTFTVSVRDSGVRAVDSKGIQQYTGANAKTVSFGFNAEKNGTLRLSLSSSNPAAAILVADANKESGKYSVFKFDIEERDDVDTLITDVTIDVATSSGTVMNDIRNAYLVIDGDEFRGTVNAAGTITFDAVDVEVGGKDKIQAELKITLARAANAGSLTFSLDADDLVAEGVDSGNASTVTGSADGKTHTTALSGIAAKAVSTSQSVSTPGSAASSTIGTYTIRFDVTALEDNAFIDDVAASSTTEGAGFVIFGDSYAGTISAILTSTATLDGGTRYIVRQGTTETFTLTVTLDPSAAGTFGVRLDKVRFAATNATATAGLTIDASNQDFRTNAVYIAN